MLSIFTEVEWYPIIGLEFLADSTSEVHLPQGNRGINKVY